MTRLQDRYGRFLHLQLLSPQICGKGFLLYDDCTGAFSIVTALFYDWLGKLQGVTGVDCLFVKNLGIPVAIDFTPQWGKRSLGHSWCTLIGKGYQLPFLFYDKVPLGEHLADMRKRDGLAKVYRRMYSEQEAHWQAFCRRRRFLHCLRTSI